LLPEVTFGASGDDETTDGGNSLKHILHVEYDDEDRRMTATHVPTAYVILFGMLAYLSKAFSADFVNMPKATTPAQPETAIAGPDGHP
jgi:hypothetical protein